MKNILLFSIILVCAQGAFAAEQFKTKIECYRNDVLRGTPTIITTLEDKGEILQTTGEFYLSRSVFFQKSDTADRVKLTLNIKEHLSQASFDIDDIFEIGKEETHKTLTVRSGKDVFRYEVTVTTIQ